MEDRPALLSSFKEILYAESEDKLQDFFDNLISSDVASKYVNFKKYATDVFEDREAWALCYRDELPIRGSVKLNFWSLKTRFLTDRRKLMLLVL